MARDPLLSESIVFDLLEIRIDNTESGERACDVVLADDCVKLKQKLKICGELMSCNETIQKSIVKIIS